MPKERRQINQITLWNRSFNDFIFARDSTKTLAKEVNNYSRVLACQPRKFDGH